MIYENKGSMLLTRHRIKLFYIYGKFLIYILPFFAAVILFFMFRGTGENGAAMNLTIFYIFLAFINFSVFALILDIITHFNNLIYINDSHIYIIQNKHIIREDIEIIDLGQVTKVNVICQGFLPNLFSFGKLTIEQQQVESRSLFYISQPYKVLADIRAKTEKLSSLGNKKNDLNTTKYNDTKYFG